MARTDQTYRKRLAAARQIIEGSYDKNWPNVFILGTHGRRINFTSQQIRAMNLIWALLETGVITSTSKVCVVGAGLSGIAAAACLVENNICTALFDKQIRPLFEQSYTHHRFVHPSVNFWPEGAVNPSTNFPFFDWFAGRCSDVAKDIINDWNKHFKGNVDEYFGHEVVGLERDGVKTKLHYQTKAGVIVSEAFDVVVLALGFGGERKVPGNKTPSYWRSDNLEVDRQAPEFSETIISGIGDGALIDLFRLSFDDAFDLGKLIVLFANKVALNRLSEGLAEAERHCRSLHPDAASLRLSEAYRKAASAIDRNARLVLVSALERRMKNRLILVAPQPGPFSIKAAPIHKLILAVLESEGFFRFLRGSVRKEKAGNVEIDDAGTIIQLRGHLVARIGSEHAISKFAKYINVDELIMLQQAKHDQNFPARWEPKRYYLADGRVVRSRNSPAFVSDRAERVNRRISEIHPGIKHVAITVKPDGKRELIAELAPNWSVNQIDNLPSKLFGIPLSAGPSRWMKTL